mgnify:CR=1 FL=1|tara:strand:+ start:7514 stop:9955 length:2442 start_codon:yes stop_codon:yes gene_type:complete
MTVLIGDEPVNSGNTGWSRSDVLTALEKVFYELGWNSGTQENGVPVCCKPPEWTPTSTELGTQNGQETPYPNSAQRWEECGGPSIIASGVPSYAQQKFYVTSNGTTDYQIYERLDINSYGVDITNEIIVVNSNNLPTGTKLTYAPGETAGDATKDITGLSPGDVVYLHKVSINQIKLCVSEAAALAGSAFIDLSANPQYPYYFVTDAGTNPTITLNSGDIPKFIINDNSGGNFYLMDMAEGGYVSDRTIVEDPVTGALVNQNTGGNNMSGVGTEGDPLVWNTSYWQLTENEVFDPTKDVAGTGYQGVYSYGYANDTYGVAGTAGTMKGAIVIVPYVNSNTYMDWHQLYWKYTVPASGGRSELKLRVYRDSNGTDQGKVCGLTINSKGTGWSNNEVFTIPGDQIGGATPANDIVFGINAAETSTGLGDGKPSIHVTNLGAGQNMYQKHPDGDYCILRLENDANKKFGTTYWSFGFDDDLNYMHVENGIGWTYLNRLGEHTPQGTDGSYVGNFNGDRGLDLGAIPYPIINSSSNAYYDNRFYYARIGTPTSYPLNIRYYKAQAPQDDNFCVIQFTQTINTEVIPYFTFALHKGPNFGANVYDLDECWTGTMTRFCTANTDNQSSNDTWVDTRFNQVGYGYSSTSTEDEPVTYASKAREGSYGWMRNPNSGGIDIPTRYECNIDTFNSNIENQVIQYFRDDTYDRFDLKQNSYEENTRYKDGIRNVGTTSDWYKPLKGLPICNQLAPCPFYMPDDFVMLQVAVTPGQTEFRPGDQVDISSSEKYKIILSDNIKDQTGLDGTTGATAVGMLFCARVT